MFEFALNGLDKGYKYFLPLKHFFCAALLVKDIRFFGSSLPFPRNIVLDLRQFSISGIPGPLVAFSCAHFMFE
jgi:hypothetical protein